MGCGIACVACVTRNTYKKALEATEHGKKYAETVGFSPKTLHELLSILDKTYSRRYLKRKLRKYPTGSIVYLKRSKRFPFGHYVAKTEDGWMDPWINLPQYPRRAGFRKKLPQKATYLIYPVEAK